MNIAIVLAAGRSERFGEEKIFLNLWGKPVLFWSLRAFEDHDTIDQIVLVASKENKDECEVIAKNFSKIHKIILGGKTRFESALHGFTAIGSSKNDIILFHNAANPGITASEILEVIKKAQQNGVAGVGKKITSTVRRMSEKKSEVIERNSLYKMETPQALKANICTKGFEIWKEKNKIPTDDVALAEVQGILPKIVPVSWKNRKITTLEDLKFLECIRDSELRMGLGEDSHQFSSEQKTCMIGGVVIPNCPGFEANSDGDVALHALCNALLSAVGGTSFSRIADLLCAQGITDSTEYLKEVLNVLKEKNGSIQNISLSFEGSQPKLESHLPKIRKRLAKLLNIAEENIGLTVHTGEKLSSFGKGEGMRCQALATIRIRNP